MDEFESTALEPVSQGLKTISTRDLSTQLAIEADVIRHWKDRAENECVEGTHWVRNDAGHLRWLPAGVDWMRDRAESYRRAAAQSTGERETSQTGETSGSENSAYALNPSKPAFDKLAYIDAAAAASITVEDQIFYLKRLSFHLTDFSHQEFIKVAKKPIPVQVKAEPIPKQHLSPVVLEAQITRFLKGGEE